MRELESEARERQALNALTNQPQNSKKISYLENHQNGRVTEQAAKIFNTNQQYVYYAKTIKAATAGSESRPLQPHTPAPAQG